MPNASARIRELKKEDLEDVRRFADLHIGQNYFTIDKLEKIYAASLKDGRSCSFVIDDGQGIQGIRLTCQPGQWLERHPSQAPHPELWRVPLSSAAYFQSLFLAKEYQAQGWGRRLSMASIESLRMSKARAVVCHSWDESPGNSSRKYLDRLGFEAVLSIPHFWKEIDYDCEGCHKRPCVCNATEMVLYL